MDAVWEQVAKVLIAAVPAGVALAGVVRGPGALRSRLRHDVELVEKLPSDSAARRVLLESVSAQIERIRQTETNASRDKPMLVFSLLAAPSLGYVTLWLVQKHEWWSYLLALLSGVFSLIFIYGIFETAERVPRDEKRKRISPPST